jgi:hypothetical protein
MKHYSQLTLEQRYGIYSLLKTGFKPEFVNGYGSYSFPIEKGYGGFVAKKCE